MSHTDRQMRTAGTHDGNLGRLLFQGRPSIARGVVFLVVGFAWPLLSFGLFFDPDPKGPLIAALGGLFSTIFITIGVVYLVPRLGSEFFFYERGVMHVLRGRQRVLMYEDVGE